MTFNFNLQLFGGKGGSSTTVQSAKPTAQELRLQDVQANYAEKTAPTALALQSMGANMILSNPGVVPVDYGQLGNKATQQAYDLQNRTADTYRGYEDLGNQVDALKGVSNQNLQAGTKMYADQTATNKTNTTNNAQTMQPLMNGELPAAYAANQQYAINRGANTAMGDMLADKMSRGIINSSVTNTGIQGISDSVANTLSQNYNQNMAQAAALQNQNANQQQMGFTNQSGINTGLMGLQQQDFANQQNLINMNSGLLGQQGDAISQQSGLLSQPMALANSAQNASIDIPAKLLALSQGQQSDTSSLLNTLSGNRIADKTTTQKTSGTGLLGGLLSGVGSYYGAKG
jgi:hypothetical protein